MLLHSSVSLQLQGVSASEVAHMCVLVQHGLSGTMMVQCVLLVGILRYVNSVCIKVGRPMVQWQQLVIS